MAVYRNKNGTWSVNIYDLQGKRKVKRFPRKVDADAYDLLIKNQKREAKLISANLIKANVSIEKTTSDLLSSKPDIREKTRYKYEATIMQFRLFCAGRKIENINDFTPDNATEFFKALQTNNPRPKTVNAYLALIRSLFKSEIMKGHIVKNPFDHIRNLRVEKKIPDYYTKAELKSFFAQDMKVEYRNAFTCFMHTGMRFEELANLTWADIDLKEKLIKVRSKGDFRTKTFNSERNIPMNKTLQALLTELSKNPSDYVFPGINGKKLDEKHLLRVCKIIGKAAKIAGRIYIHKFRHTFASHLVQNGVRIEEIQKLLGHSSINETMIYACLKPEGLHEQVSVLDDLL